MAVTITLVEQGANNLRYLVSYDGTEGTGTSSAITTTGAASPDLRTDSLAGPLKKLARAVTDGFGNFAAGSLTQAQAKALWESDFSTVNPSAPSGKRVVSPVTAKLNVVPSDIGTNGNQLPVEADVSSGQPVIRVAVAGGAALDQAAAWYLDVYVPGAIGY